MFAPLAKGQHPQIIFLNFYLSFISGSQSLPINEAMHSKFHIGVIKSTASLPNLCLKDHKIYENNGCIDRNCNFVLNQATQDIKIKHLKNHLIFKKNVCFFCTHANTQELIRHIDEVHEFKLVYVSN